MLQCLLLSYNCLQWLKVCTKNETHNPHTDELQYDTQVETSSQNLWTEVEWKLRLNTSSSPTGLQNTFGLIVTTKTKQ
jgi:hypothetical protein